MLDVLLVVSHRFKLLIFLQYFPKYYFNHEAPRICCTEETLVIDVYTFTGYPGPVGATGFTGETGATGATGASVVLIHGAKRRVVRQTAGCPGKLVCRFVPK